MSQGVIQNFHASKTVQTVAAQGVDSNGHAIQSQTIPGGPVASMNPIEVLGDNGGGFFNANTAHPYQGPNPITGILLMWLVVMIPFAFPYTFGRMVGSMAQGYVVLASMVLLFFASVLVMAPLEGNGNNKLPATVSQAATSTHAGGNLEGKDLRIGVGGSTINAASVTATSAGAQDSAHESYTPLGGSVPLVNMLLGEVSPGGDGSGLYGKLILVLLSVFIAGLMVGRTPEYLGKKIQSTEMKLVVIYILIVPVIILVFSAIAIAMKTPVHSLFASGPHGLTEMVYTYTSTANNNGSSFAGITANTQWFNSTTGLVMLIGRYFTIIPVLAIGGSLVRKQVVPATAGTFRTDTPLFVGLLLAVTVILVGLVYFPMLALGPIVEHLVGPLFLPFRFLTFIVRRAMVDSVKKLHPRTEVRNPVMFVVFIGSLLTTYLFVRDLPTASAADSVFTGLVAIWLWFTVLFANFAEAVAEGRGKAQADTLRKTRSETPAHVLLDDGSTVDRQSSELHVGDRVVVVAGEIIPGDGDVIEGIASVDESAITGESAPVIRESGGDRSAVTGGTRVSPIASS